MAEKKPLVLKNGYTQELQEGDTLPTESIIGGTKTTGYVPVVQEDGTVAWEEIAIPEPGISLGLAIALS